MSHNIDLKKYKIRTDLAVEELENLKQKIDGIIVKEEEKDDLKITTVEVDKIGSKKVNKTPGKYITIEFKDITDFNMQSKVKEYFSNELKRLLLELNIKENSSCLVIGLGNRNSTPDSLGPCVIDNILVTKHLFDLEGANVEEGFRCVSAFIPGVMGTTGIETSEIILSLIKSAKPDFIIAIDALASQAISRVNKTIQITDSGIHPGSGVGNARRELNKDTVGIPVIAIGVPTVVDAVTIVGDTINYINRHFSYKTENYNNPINKLTPHVNIEDHEVDDLSSKQKQNLMGMIGELSEEEIKQLIFEVLTPMGYNLMVTPKEIDFVMEHLTNIIAGGINNALHRQVTKS